MCSPTCGATRTLTQSIRFANTFAESTLFDFYNLFSGRTSIFHLYDQHPSCSSLLSLLCSLRLLLWPPQYHPGSVRFLKVCASPYYCTLRTNFGIEHSHEDILRTLRPVLALNNPDNIQDVVFGLLGAAAAKTGAGNIADPDCLQQGVLALGGFILTLLTFFLATADQAFTNAKSSGDIAGMTAALQYRALERNTGSVGLASVQCTSITAKNPEIAAIQQHQDPASSGAAALNKGIVLELAKQIASIGGNPQDALQTGTFAPGQIGDPTAKGNTCDDANDANGCIHTLNLIVFDATADEITAVSFFPYSFV